MTDQAAPSAQVPDFEDETDVVTRLMRRKFAFAREVAEYDELVENEGQARHMHTHTTRDQALAAPRTVRPTPGRRGVRRSRSTPSTTRTTATSTGRTATASAMAVATGAVGASRRA